MTVPPVVVVFGWVAETGVRTGAAGAGAGAGAPAAGAAGAGGNVFASVLTASWPPTPPTAALAASYIPTARQPAVDWAPLAGWWRKFTPSSDSRIMPASPEAMTVPPA